MKSRIVLSVLLVILLVGGFFLPTHSWLRDYDEPESNPITVFQEAEESRQAEEESRTEEESRQEESEIVSNLPEAEQSAYAWAAMRSEPESMLMTPDRIAEYSASVQAAAGIDILQVPSLSSQEIQAMILEDQDALASDTTLSLTEEEMKFLLANENANGHINALRLGIVTTVTGLRKIPTDVAFTDDKGHDHAQILQLDCTMPLWVLHQSADASWYYVQSAYGRGWVPAQNVAVTDSQEVWLSYANPEKKVVITEPTYTAENAEMEMGSVFSCLEENGDSYTVLLPIREKDGALNASEVTISRSYSSLGYIDYTWTHLYKQLYKYMGTDVSLSNQDLILNVFRSFGIQLPVDLEAGFDALGTVTDLASLPEEERGSAVNSIQAPALIQDADGVGVLLGIRDGKIWKCMLRDDQLTEMEVRDPVKLVVIG